MRLKATAHRGAVEVIVVADAAALADTAAERMERVALGAAPGSRAAVALAGGSTPRAAYMRVASRCVPWRRLELFFGDERCVPPDDSASNYRMVREALLDRVPIDPEAVHRIKGELSPAAAADEAEAELRAGRAGSWPVLDQVVLGMGPDGHTASLFPGSPGLRESRRAMMAVHAPHLPQPWRVTMTLPVLNAARDVLILVADVAKAPMVARAVTGDPAVPAGLVRPTDGRLTWILTEAAASEL